MPEFIESSDNMKQVVLISESKWNQESMHWNVFEDTHTHIFGHHR